MRQGSASFGETLFRQKHLATGTGQSFADHQPRLYLPCFHFSCRQFEFTLSLAAFYRSVCRLLLFFFLRYSIRSATSITAFRCTSAALAAALHCASATSSAAFLFYSFLPRLVPYARGRVCQTLTKLCSYVLHSS